MSEAIRSYRPAKGGRYNGPGRPGGVFRWLVPVLVLTGIVWLVWTTRDSHSLSEVIPRDQSYHFQVRDLLSSRQEIAHSALWETGLIPDNYADIPAWMGNSFGLPEWVLNNLISDTCYVSGTDLMRFSDLIVVTRMSRVGCLVERYHRFIDEIEDEYAGGLALRKLSDIDFYYAVRGRTLIFSPSRDAIIRALTLRDVDAITSLETAGLNASGDLRGRMAFADDEPLGQYFERSDCQFNIAPDAITFSSHSVLKSDWRAPLDALGMTRSGGNIPVPEEGGVVLAGSFGVPLARVWQAANTMLENALNEMVQRWGFLDQLSNAEREAFLATLGPLTDALGTNFVLHTFGFDTDAMLPLPMIALSIEPDLSVANALMEAVPRSPFDALPQDGVPYRRGEESTLRLPIGWGNIIEPCAEIDANRMLLTLLPSQLAALHESKRALVSTGETGHMFFRLRPSALVDMLGEGALLFAEQGMLQGQGTRSVETVLHQAAAISERVTELRILLAYVDGGLSMEIRLELAPPGT